MFLPHMNHVSVSPTDGNGPTQGQRKTLTRVGIEPTTFGRTRGIELCRQKYTTSCVIELKSNFSLNQAWPERPR